MPGKPESKIFNCVVDDIALIIGTKKSTRDGFRKWVANGAIRLYVPLYTLGQLDFLKSVSDRIGSEAREVLEWLDEVTTAHPQHAMLQGGQETYDTWAEVEKHLLPETLLSAPDDASDELTENLEQTSLGSATPSSPRSARSSTNSASAPASPAKTTKSISSVQSSQAPAPVSMPETEEKDTSPEDKSTIPQRLQPLLNHLLWRIHKDPQADSDFRSYIFVANNPDARSAAQRFGVRVKTFEQVREVIKREERDLKNRMAFWRKENQGASPVASPAPVAQAPEKPMEATKPPTDDVDPDSDEEVIVMRPRGSPPKPTVQTPAPAKPVLDPNDFGRAARSPNTAPTGPNRRGGRGGANASRGALRGSPKTQQHHAPFAGSAQRNPTCPIDPDSYARPPPSGGNMRGGRRKLWTPT
ncbi:hypothetical protein EV356DRAFT_526223 [Viridothelium virens]|uniref:PIN domain-containing protein n=1 Tax=Viridothelium virens TaxID=1048519 RepID=A0A6A6GZE4_VIRVR|nr:hypothetical protein EV356DRAFT_526223 [Viridothelium virens]